MFENRGHLLTEQSNPNSQDLDRLDSLALVDLFCQEDARTIEAVAASRESIARAIDRTAESLRRGGRLFYIGAGTSGRLGVLDAAECPPTFCTPPDMVQGILAGGKDALVRSSEALEDRAEDGEAAIAHRDIGDNDVVVGISAGGTTPYVRGALREARRRNATTVFIACVPVEQVSAEVDVDIRLLVGPEVLAGSTRLKAGTVTKLVLNILSTSVMVRLGKVFGNRMVDVSVTNRKLLDRAVRTIVDLTELSRDEAAQLLDRCGNRVKLALLVYWSDWEVEAAQSLLDKHQGQLRPALDEVRG
ncbi:MAG: N-acetylmuramic acid 6-phosphate etherase [Cyanobacteria bacterium SID2]|nr:N-acetylmuramic acid 6-phosphate etherase [Cyanobacteria bacterium SID2]MBP0003374.1 N-acetylmuramic acid 6-phosphate etherase [Cyanobacteria bacterium SBC]